MCDLSEKLVAWMDGELPESESGDFARHVSGCGECSDLLAVYKHASGAFDAYCEATFAAETRRNSPRWLPAAVAAGMAAAAVIAASLILPHQRVAQLPHHDSSQAAAPVAAQHAPPAAMTANRANAAHPIVGAINRAPRQSVAAAVPHGRDIARGTASLAIVQSPEARNVSPILPEPQIEIAIPADDMFPPGAMPPGISFAADLTISADGWAEQLGLRPRVAAFQTGFEGRRNQP